MGTTVYGLEAARTNVAGIEKELKRMNDMKEWELWQNGWRPDMKLVRRDNGTYWWYSESKTLEDKAEWEAWRRGEKVAEEAERAEMIDFKGMGLTGGLRRLEELEEKGRDGNGSTYYAMPPKLRS